MMSMPRKTSAPTRKVREFLGHLSPDRSNIAIIGGAKDDGTKSPRAHAMKFQKWWGYWQALPFSSFMVDGEWLLTLNVRCRMEKLEIHGTSDHIPTADFEEAYLNTL